MTPNVQGSDEIVVNAPPEAIWHILTDTTRLPEWAPMVKQTNGTAESLGAVRQCEVEFDRRPGKVTERCSKFRPHERIAWVMEQDSFGFGRMFAAFAGARHEPLHDEAQEPAHPPAGAAQPQGISRTRYRRNGSLTQTTNTKKENETYGSTSHAFRDRW